MGYRQVIIKKSEKLSLKDNNLVVTREKLENKIPLEDINFILIEDNSTIITTKLLSELGNNAICLIICDDKHEPSSIMYPYNYHYKQLENIEYQLSQNEDIKKIIWTEIVKAKIKNEISVLRLTSKDEKAINKLNEYVNSVELGDSTNREGLAAKIYFKSLYGSDFIRFYDDSINDALNYGYTIIKSSIVRCLAVFGLNTYIGVNHKSKVNNFNLAYDLIEPYRAIVDKFVYDNINSLTSPLSFDFRKKLVNLLNSDVICSGKHCTLEYSIEILIKSYIKTISTGELNLLFPKLNNE